MKMIKTTLLLLTISLLSFSGFGQTQEFTDEATFLASLGNYQFKVESYEANTCNPSLSISLGDFSIESNTSVPMQICNDPSCPSDGFGSFDMAADEDGNSISYKFNYPISVFGTYINDAGTAGPVTITMMTSDGQSFTAFMSLGGEGDCNEHFYGIISDMLFTEVIIEKDNGGDRVFLDKTYYEVNYTIPTLSQWGIIALSMIMLILGLVFMKQRKAIFG